MQLMLLKGGKSIIILQLVSLHYVQNFVFGKNHWDYAKVSTAFSQLTHSRDILFVVWIELSTLGQSNHQHL